MAIISSPPPAILIKTRWRNKKVPPTMEERAGVIGANIWKIALAIYKHLENDGFKFGSDRQVMRVFTELTVFLVQMTDRLVYGKLSDAERATLINVVASHLATTIANNQLDLLGPGEYKAEYIAALNNRCQEYAEFDYSETGPSYACLRYFGKQVSDVMDESDNKWVAEQVVEVEAPAMMSALKKLVSGALEIEVA